MQDKGIGRDEPLARERGGGGGGGGGEPSGIVGGDGKIHYRWKNLRTLATRSLGLFSPATITALALSSLG